jgi:hypothetical protein
VKVDITETKTYQGKKNLELNVSGINHDICIDSTETDTEVEVSVVQDGHGGWECCSNHASYFSLTREQVQTLSLFFENSLS